MDDERVIAPDRSTEEAAGPSPPHPALASNSARTGSRRPMRADRGLCNTQIWWSGQRKVAVAATSPWESCLPSSYLSSCRPHWSGGSGWARPSWREPRHRPRLQAPSSCYEDGISYFYPSVFSFIESAWYAQIVIAVARDTTSHVWWAIVTDDLFAQNNSRDRFCCPPLSSRSRSRTATRRNRRSEHGSESRPARPPPFCTVRFRPLVQGCTVLKPPPAPAGKGCHRASRAPSPARSVARERRGRRRSDVPVGDESRHGQSHDDEALPRRRYRLVQFFSPEWFFRTPHDRGWVVRLIGCRGCQPIIGDRDANPRIDCSGRRGHG